MHIEKILRDSIEHSITFRELAGNFDLFLKAVEVSVDESGKEVLVVHGNRIPNHKIWKVNFEIRTDDECDPRPHFHILCKNNDVAFTIDDCQQIGGRCIDSRMRDKIRRFFVDLGGTRRLKSIMNNEDFRDTFVAIDLPEAHRDLLKNRDQYSDVMTDFRSQP